MPNAPHCSSINYCVASPDLHALKKIVVQYEVQNMRMEAVEQLGLLCKSFPHFKFFFFYYSERKKKCQH